jgi:arylsulfatase A-like enzyme
MFQSILAQQKPNIILIMTDDQGWFDTGFNGNGTIMTPNLDSLAIKGVIFDRFYSASPVCSPTRASVITGRNPNRMGIPDANSGHMKTQEITIAELLKEKGYATGHFGKWHLGIQTKKESDANRGGEEKHFKHYSIPSMHGYDAYFCTESKVPTYDPMVYPEVFKKGESRKFGWTAVEREEKVKDYNTSYWIGEEKKVEGELQGDDTMVIMDRVIPFIQKSVEAEKPFFTTIWTHSPHLPVVTSQYYKNKYSLLSNDKQLYYGSITALDDQIGCLWESLEEQGIADNTMIWFCSDNGPEDNTPGSAKPFKGIKRSLNEGGIRTPAFVVWCNGINGGRRINVPAFTSDYLPTITSLLNIDYPKGRPLDGIDLMPFIEDAELKRDKSMGFKYKTQISWVNERYKLISKNGGKSYRLYDLIKDKEEQYNILAIETTVAVKMISELGVWLKSVDNSANERDY